MRAVLSGPSTHPEVVGRVGVIAAEVHTAGDPSNDGEGLKSNVAFDQARNIDLSASADLIEIAAPQERGS
jgi:hypothetical protein